MVKPSNPFRVRSFKRLTHEELQERSRKGLYFRCDEKFGQAMYVANKQLHTLVLAEGEEEEYTEEENIVVEGDAELRVLQLSMCSIVAFMSKKTLKL